MKLNSKTLSAAIALTGALALAACSPPHENDADSGHLDTATTGAKSPKLADQTEKSGGTASDASEGPAAGSPDEQPAGAEHADAPVEGVGTPEPAATAQ